MPPYLPFLEALGQHVRSAPDAALREQAGPTAPILATLLPELGLRLGSNTSPYVLPPEQARLRLFEAVGRFVEAIGAPNGLVLVLDDLHWADPATFDLLTYLGRDTSVNHVLIAGGVSIWRDRAAVGVGACGDGAHSAARAGNAERGPARRGRDCRAGQPPTRRTTGSHHRRTARTRQRRQPVPGRRAAARLAGRWRPVQDGSRLARGRRRCEFAVERGRSCASACGTSRSRCRRGAPGGGDRRSAFRRRTAGRCIETRPRRHGDVPAASGRCRAGGGDGPDTFRFVHDVVREALYDDLAPTRRRRVHAAIGTHLETDGHERSGVSRTWRSTSCAAAIVSAGRVTPKRQPLRQCASSRRWTRSPTYEPRWSW